MNRRKAIFTGIITGTAGLVAFSSVKWFEQRYSPILTDLSTKENLLAALAETIIPTTETPGAEEAEAHLFILYAVINCANPRDQRNFLDGLQQLEIFASKEYNLSFEECNLKAKAEILAYFEEKGQVKSQFLKKIKTRLFGLDFFSILKKFTIWGYCTSKLGASKGMAYDYIPGDFQAILPLQTNQKAWATK